MGIFQVELEIGDPQGHHFETIDALVDSGATYTTLPESLLRRLGVVPLSRANFILADGSRMERGIGQTWMRLEGEEFIVPVVFGTEATQPLLGAVTLEIFRLGIDPVSQRLIPVDGLLLVNKESRLDDAILLYQQDEVTLSRAAELAGIHS